VDTDADIYCLQEVYCAPPGMPESAFYPGDDDRPVRPYLFQEIDRALPFHRGYFYPAANGYLHDGAAVKEDILFGLATFVRGDIPILAERMKFVFGQFRHRGWMEPPLPRNAHGLRLSCPRTGAVTTLVHLHGLWLPGVGKVDTPERLEQAASLRGLVMSLVEDKNDRVMVCGDFNVLPESKTFELLADFAPRNLIKEFEVTDTRTSFYKKSFSRYADYLLVSENVEVGSFQVPAEPEVSDHRALVIDFR
jgi:endonuclease/exonuclease/phosphatase family metal-dependent hydrolase